MCHVSNRDSVYTVSVRLLLKRNTHYCIHTHVLFFKSNKTSNKIIIIANNFLFQKLNKKKHTHTHTQYFHSYVYKKNPQLNNFFFKDILILDLHTTLPTCYI